MKNSANSIIFRIVNISMLLLTAGAVQARGQTNSAAGWGDGFVKTNGEWVTIGEIMVETNSPLNTDVFKRFKWREDGLWKILNSKATNHLEVFVEGSRALIKDYPKEANGYQNLMAAMDDYNCLGNTNNARALADELASGSGPEKFRLWAKGFLNRLDSYNKPISMQFTAVDGRNVNLAAMKGKVVLVDFWATTCGPCVAELPRVNAAYDKFHDQGFEIVGVSCDTDKEKLERYLKEKGYSWPQYFDGKQQDDSKFTQGFGIDGIPHMFLVDKKGILRFDDVRANDKVHRKGDGTSFEEKISQLLAEPGNFE